MIIHTTDIRVRYNETDAMGVTHHGSYITWFEVARIQLLDDLGVPYKYLEEKGYYSPVTKIQVSYLKPTFFDDRLKVKSIIKEPVRARFYISYEIFREEQKIAIGESEHVFVNKEKNIIKPPKIFYEAIMKFLINVNK